MQHRLAASALVLCLLVAPRGDAADAGTPTATLDTARIEELTGVKGQLDPKEGVFKVSMPRGDLDMRITGVHVTPPLGLTTWAAFTRVGDHAAVMGDLVLLEDQVNPVMTTALDAGLEITALHNHFLFDSPKVMFMHLAGMGSEADLARSVGKVFTKIRETSGGKGEVPRTDVDPARSTLDPKKIEAVTGVPGTLKDGVYKLVVGRTTKTDGHVMGSTMGVNTWAAFAGSDEEAVVDGDVAMLESELQPVLKALRGRGLQIAAIHNHMTKEEPRILFLHYWGVGSTTALARAVRDALDLTHGTTP